MKLSRAELGPLGTNAYFLIEEESKEAWVIDPGGNGLEVVKFLQEQELLLRGIFFTHGHSDHIGGAQELVDTFSAPMYIHERDKAMLTSATLNLSASWGMKIEIQGDVKLVKDGDSIICGDTVLHVLETPGHTPGGICFYVEELYLDGFKSKHPVLFAGDTLFQGSVGRTDFPGGSMDTLLASIAKKLYSLPDDTVVFPGHGAGTTIGNEKKGNPFIKGSLSFKNR